MFSAVLLALVASIFFSTPVHAQPGLVMPVPVLSQVVQVDQADHASLALLELAKAQIAEQQWGEALDKLRQVEQSAGDKLIQVDNHRYAPLREYCQLLIGRFPKEGLAAYRDRVDSLAKNWYDEGVKAHDQQLLEKLLDHYFNSTYGDDALSALGEMALEQGEHQRARSHWERISHKFRPAGGLPLTMGYPDTDLNLADVRARLVLVSILEGDIRRARLEQKEFARQYPAAQGKLGGRNVVYAEALAEMIAAAKDWPTSSQPAADWPTFAGSPTRQHVAPRALELLNRLAEFPVPLQKSAMLVKSGLPQFNNEAVIGFKPEMPALAYFPVVTNNLLLFNTGDEVLAYRADTGKPAWLGDAEKPGRIFFDRRDERPATPKARRRGPGSVGSLGVPRHTLTVLDRWLLVRMGDPITAREFEFSSGAKGSASYVVCLDLHAEGRLNWKITPDDQHWAFEGSPVSDGTSIYVVMRKHDRSNSQQHVACFDLQSGTLRWRQYVCGAQSVSRGLGDDITHNLLTLVDNTLYLNTNLGAVAALCADDGRIRWLTTYPRNSNIDLAQTAACNLIPAIYQRGKLFAAAADSASIIALDAFTGQVIWENEVPEAIEYVLGILDNKLWASGKSLWALDIHSGNVDYHSAQADDRQAVFVGNGRGLLAGGNVYWPVRSVPVEPAEPAEPVQPIDRPPPSNAKPAVKQPPPEYQIRVVEAQTARELPPIELSKLNPHCESGNLMMSENRLVIASPERVTLFELQKSKDD